ncbi:MAG: hypothetical protein LBV12_13155 [Puniceicoccales bacterium]|jgi:polyhydroxyalkanoate synthesis regulator phasin|nr:hypothetical protein [Puniceicoccales bacterium]
MIDTVKKTLLAGLGAAVVTKETVEGALHDWIEKGKITPEEARGFADRLINTGESRWEKAKDEVAQKISDVVQKAPFARKSELNALEARIAVLEQAILRAQFASANQPSTESDIH